MSESHTVARICEQLVSKSRRHGICGFHLFFAESVTRCDDRGHKKVASGTLTLTWVDGSQSVHHIDGSAAFWSELPFAEWRQVRFPEQQPLRLHRAGQTATYPPVKLYDHRTARLLQSPQLPSGPEPFCRRLTYTREWVVHSQGLTLEAKSTRVELHHRHLGPALSYRSRRYPTAEELAYLETEAKWFSRCAPGERQRVIEPQEDRKLCVLFSPDAFRTLLHYGFAAPLLADTADAKKTTELLHENPSALLSLSIDPLRPWSCGSYRFTPTGHPAATVELTKPAAHRIPIRDRYRRDALHWSTGRCQSFRHFLRSVEEVCLVSQLHIPEYFSPCAPVTLWAPQTIRFRRGRPILRGMLPLTVTLSSLLTSRQLLFVERIGWDGTGVAVSCPVVGIDS